MRKFKIKEMFTRFDTTHERDSDRWTDGQTDSIDRAVHSVARQQLLKTEQKHVLQYGTACVL